MTRYAAPGSAGSVVDFQTRYDHFIGGDYVPPVKGQYFENPTPVTGRTSAYPARTARRGGAGSGNGGRTTSATPVAAKLPPAVR
jgi:hypothetical protein